MRCPYHIISCVVLIYLPNGGSDQNLSEIKVAGNQKLRTNSDFLLIKAQQFRRKSASKFFVSLLCVKHNVHAVYAGIHQKFMQISKLFNIFVVFTKVLCKNKRKNSILGEFI